MKAQSTIEKEMQLLWRQHEFYVRHRESPLRRSWQEDQRYGATMALRWVLEQGGKMSKGSLEYDEAKEKGKS